MDIRAFYQKIREIEKTIVEDFAVVVSHPTSDGGKGGVLTEVTRATAALLVTEAKARLATPEESAAFHDKQAELLRVAKAAEQASRMQVTVLSDTEVQKLRERLRPQKG
jgi:hypothetical protein